VTYYAFPSDSPAPWWKRSIAATTVAGLHVLALFTAFGLAVRPDLVTPLQALTVRLFEAAPVPPRLEPLRPQPAPLVPPRKAPVAPPPVMTAAAVANTASNFTVAAQPEPGVIDTQPAPPVPMAITAARFDADYLQNPKPEYPAISRRMREEGTVVLRVRVSAQGTSLVVEIKRSSGFVRLDEAARAAVERWRFVPARQGSEAIEATVLVPLRFSLDN